MRHFTTCRLAVLPVAILLFSLILFRESAAAQLTDWAVLLGGAGNEAGYSVAADYDGSVVVAGSFEGTTNIGGAQLSSAGYTDVFVAKFSRSGGLLWAKRLGGISTDDPGEAAIDKETGDVVVTGRFATTATVDNQVLRSTGSHDVFVARFSKSGTLQWALAFGSPNDDLAAGVAVDPNGDSLVAGQFRGTFTCGQTTLTSAGGIDMFVANVSLDGALRWCRRFGGAFDDSSGGIAVSDTGVFALTGAFGTATDLGGGPLSSAGLFDAFVAVYAVGNGDYRWARRMGGSGYDGGHAVKFDPTGALVLTGYFGLFGGSVDFGGGVLATQGGADTFVAKYNGSDGQYVWASKFGGTYDDYGNALSVDQAGTVVIAGEFQGSASFAGSSASSKGQFDAFLAAYSSDGAPLWWRSYGDLVNDKAFGTAVDFEGNWLVTGFSLFRIDLGQGLLYSAGQADAFLAKIKPGVVSMPTPSRTFTPTPLPATPTRTPTRAPTLTFTPTRAFTATSTRAIQSTATFTPTRTLTRTPTLPAATDTPAPAATATATGTDPRLPPTIPNLVLWLDASQITGVPEGSAVSAWNDASGQGHHAIQLLLQNRPTYRSAALNGRPALRFDGSNDYLRIAGSIVSGTQARTVLFVARPDVVGNKGIVDLGNGATPGAGFLITPEYGVRVNGGSRLWLPSASTQEAQIGVVQFVGTTTTGVSLWINGTLRSPTSTIAAAIQTSGSGSVGTWTAGPVGSNNFDGDIAEIIVYSRALSADERQGVQQYLDTKY